MHLLTVHNICEASSWLSAYCRTGRESLDSSMGCIMPRFRGRKGTRQLPLVTNGRGRSSRAACRDAGTAKQPVATVWAPRRKADRQPLNSPMPLGRLQRTRLSVSPRNADRALLSRPCNNLGARTLRSRSLYNGTRVYGLGPCESRTVTVQQCRANRARSYSSAIQQP